MKSLSSEITERIRHKAGGETKASGIARLP